MRKCIAEKIGMKQNNEKIYIAVTGGMGSGKSTVMRMIAECGYPTLSADEVAHHIYEDEKVYHDTLSAFPSCFDNGVLNRKKLADTVFIDQNKRSVLEGITHPAIMQKLFLQAETLPGKYIFFEIPLLFEGGYQNLFDHIIVVMRDIEHRIKAISVRDGLNEGDIMARINNQVDYEKNLYSGHTVIYNDGDFAALYKKVVGVVHEITAQKD